MKIRRGLNKRSDFSKDKNTTDKVQAKSMTSAAKQIEEIESTDKVEPTAEVIQTEEVRASELENLTAELKPLGRACANKNIAPIEKNQIAG